MSHILAQSPCFVMFRKQVVCLRAAVGVVFLLTAYSVCVKAVCSEPGRLQKVRGEVVLRDEDLSWSMVLTYRCTTKKDSRCIKPRSGIWGNSESEHSSCSCAECQVNGSFAD